MSNNSNSNIIIGNNQTAGTLVGGLYNYVIGNGGYQTTIIGGNNSSSTAIGHGTLSYGGINSGGYQTTIIGGNNSFIGAGTYINPGTIQKMFSNWDNLKSTTKPSYEKHSDQVWLIHNLLDQTSCQSLINAMDHWKSKFSNVKNYNSSDGYSESDGTGAKFMTNFLKPYFPQLYQDQKGKIWRFERIDSFYTWDIYGSVRILQAPYDNTHFGRIEDECRLTTCYISLNDDFQGGGTTLYSHLDTLDGNNIITEIDQIHPKQGTALFFDTDLAHQINPITTGTKYWIKFDLQYFQCPIQIQWGWDQALGADEYQRLIQKLLFSLSSEVERKQKLQEMLVSEFGWLIDLIYEYYH